MICLFVTTPIGLQVTLRLCEGLEFEIRLPGGNDAKERVYKIIKEHF